MADNQVDLKLNLDFQGVNDALYQMIGQFNGTDKEFQKIANSIEKNAKNLEAAIKLFGPASQQASSEVKKLQKDFQSLVAQGIDPASDSFKKMSASIPTPGKIDATANSVKKSNMQYTNLALVLQDLPYGFRGIQNNLPALIGGMAGVTGAFYLAASAAIALYTAYDMGLFKSKEATEKAKEKTEALKKQKEASDSIFESTAQEAAQVGVLISVIKNETETRDRKLTALEDLKKINPEIFDGLNLEKNAVIGLDDAYKNYIENLGTIIAVKTKQAELELIIAKRLKAQGVTLSQEEQDIVATGNALRKVLDTKKTDLELRTRNTKETAKEAKQQVLINGLKNQETKILRNIQQLSKGIKLKDPKKEPEVKKPQVDTTRLDTLKKEQKMYKDDIDMFYQYGIKIIKEEERLAVEKAKIEGKSNEQIKEIRKGFKADLLVNQQDFGRKLMEQADKNTKAFEDNENKEIESQKKSYKEKLSLFDDFYRDKQNLSTGDRLKQKSIYEQEGSDLQYMLENNLITYDDYIKRLGVTFKGWSNNNKAITAEAAASIIQIGNGIMSALGPSMDMLLDKSANIGEVLQKMFTDLLKQLVKVAVTAAITALLISIIFPETLAKAGITGGNLFSGLFTQGMGLGSMAFPPKKMANGGIVSGPTMGLMGEYPGASHNPEVVAPLDKLKTLIGGGSGGQFVLRGQDLLLSVNRAQKASNLKGQNISLA
jgi:Asp/Glu/hydantoin racemase